MPTMKQAIIFLCLSGLLLTPGCTWRDAGAGSPDRTAAHHAQISRILHRQAADWNRGDVEAFMQPYWRSPDLTFSTGGTVTRGWDQTLQRYRTRYPNRAAMGHLRFTDLEITPLGDRAALVLGRWHLQRTQPVGGAFTLVLRRIDGGWHIVHDHTSVDAP